MKIKISCYFSFKLDLLFHSAIKELLELKIKWGYALVILVKIQPLFMEL